MSNKFFKLFKSKKSKQDDELDKFMKIHAASNKSNQENERPTTLKHKDPLDVTATACYHTEVAPRTRKGPKSLPGERHDECDRGYMNRSFETEVPRQRRRAASPDYVNETRPHRQRHGNAFSEFNGPVSRRKDLEYHKMVHEESDEEDVDVASLKHTINDLKKRLAHTLARKNQYKQEYQDLVEIRRSTDKAYKAQEKNYQEEIKKQQDEVQRLRNEVQILHTHMRNMQVGMQQEPMNGMRPFFQSYPLHFPSTHIRSDRDSHVSDPQPTKNDLFPMSFSHDFPDLQSFRAEDRDETKVFQYNDNSFVAEDISDQMDITH